jgi:hypothetical protein
VLRAKEDEWELIAVLANPFDDGGCCRLDSMLDATTGNIDQGQISGKWLS